MSRPKILDWFNQSCRFYIFRFKKINFMINFSLVGSVFTQDMINNPWSSGSIRRLQSQLDTPLTYSCLIKILV